MCVCVYVYVYVYMYIYIYIYVYTCTQVTLYFGRINETVVDPDADGGGGPGAFGEGQMGSALMGSLQILCFTYLSKLFLLQRPHEC